MGRIGGTVAALAAALGVALAGAAPAAGQIQPFGQHDAGGFRNILPPGSEGVDNAAQLALFQANGIRPKHWDDQQPLYEGLVQASASEEFGMAEVRRYFKDATFGVRENQVESVTTPRPGVRIVRDEGFGVPSIYGETRPDTMFGIGYASAQDRLFFMDILRNAARAQLSSFAGGSEGNREMDRTQWQLAPYTEADLQAQLDAADDQYGKEGAEVVEDVENYVAGINAYITDALANPALLPGEYAAFGKVPLPWKPTDVIAEASLIGGIFSPGGGGELENALLMRDFTRRFGVREGRRAYTEFRGRNDPEAPTTARERFPYLTGSAFKRRGLALPDRGTVERVFVAPPFEEEDAPPPEIPGGLSDIGSQLLRMLRSPGSASNWLMVPGRNSATGRPIGVLGPQVGYFVPQVLMEQDVHGPGIDARGTAFPGTNLYVQLGHGRDYAWSATTASSDHIDTFAEVLCRDDFHYRHKGRCLPMEKLERTNTWTPNASDQTPPGSETLTAFRTVHGIVFARGEVDGKKVAFVRARSTYFHEADSAIFFKRINDPRFMRDGAKSFFRAIRGINFSFNWAYLDHKNTAYHLSGWYPRRPRGTSPDFPVVGTGRFDWRGFDPETRTADWRPLRRVPHAVDQRFLISWNNKQAPGWAASDDNYAYGPLQRSQLLSDRVRRGLRGGRKLTLPKLVQAMEEPATEDIRAVKLMPTLLRALGEPRSPELRRAVGLLRRWHRAGGHRRDLDRDGRYEHTRAVALMDAWWPLLVEAQFRPVLGKRLFESVQRRLAVGDHTRSTPRAPGFFAGWWGYVSKDLRSVFGDDVRGAFSRRYCGDGSRRECRSALRDSLQKALEVSPDELYAHGDCQGDPRPSCWDQNRPTIASGVSMPPFPFQNRPTFQQTVSVQRNVPPR